MDAYILLVSASIILYLIGIFIVSEVCNRRSVINKFLIPVSILILFIPLVNVVTALFLPFLYLDKEKKIINKGNGRIKRQGSQES